MKYQTLTAAAALFTAAVAAPAPCAGDKCGDDKYPAPVGGWENVKYDAPKGGWESVNYNGSDNNSDKKQDDKVDDDNDNDDNDNDDKDCLFNFTSEYRVIATPDQVHNGTAFTGGLEGALGYYNLGLDTTTNTICYNITIFNFRGEYQSAASTSTHIHEAPAGDAGPPRIAFPNPVPVSDDKRISIGCLTGPFVTGIEGDDGVDLGANFNVAQIEANPAGFFADVHSSLAVPGAVRGQIA